jgi:hypothetical protein
LLDTYLWAATRIVRNSSLFFIIMFSLFFHIKPIVLVFHWNTYHYHFLKLKVPPTSLGLKNYPYPSDYHKGFSLWNPYIHKTLWNFLQFLRLVSKSMNPLCRMEHFELGQYNDQWIHSCMQLATHHKMLGRERLINSNQFQYPHHKLSTELYLWPHNNYHWF